MHFWIHIPTCREAYLNCLHSCLKCNLISEGMGICYWKKQPETKKEFETVKQASEACKVGAIGYN
ncbi:MAG: hypothetical protein V1770_03220 [bacterium]